MNLKLVYSCGCDQLNQTILHFIVIIRVILCVKPFLVSYCCQQMKINANYLDIF